MADVPTLDLDISGFLASGPNGRPLPYNAEDVKGFLAPFQARARTVLMAMLAGCNRSMAAVASGVSTNTLDRWQHESPEFRQAVAVALQTGFAAVYETELYDRALDRSDRASGQLLQFLMKSRSADYREKSQLQLEVVTRANDAMGRAGGWGETE